jgi:predicted ATPase/DNA-binding CsgD family transcriptional regulator
VGTGPASPFGALLRRHRLAAGLTQEGLAGCAGLSARAVSDLERGVKRGPRPDTLRLLARALGLDSDARGALAAAAWPAAPAAPAQPQNLPAQSTPLVGRAREVAAVRARLRDPAVRLVTLTGAGGTGKTRLAVEVAAGLADAFPDGVVFVDLAPLRDPDLAVATVGQALGLWDAGHRPLLDVLKGVLAGRALLLVLDNFEQILPAAPAVGELLGACPGLKALATSRSPLRLRWERVVAVDPLGLPDRARLGDPARIAPAPAVALVVERAPAVALFVARARARRADFALTAQNARAVAEVCHRLEGLPLAIELAAARIALLPPQAMLARLVGAPGAPGPGGPGGAALRLLVGGGRDQPARHQTMRGAVAWSHDLLSPDEQALFRRLAVFAGGWTLDAAQAVGDPGRALAPDVLDLVGSLVEKSLVCPEPAPGDEPRCRLLEPIREFAAEQLAASGELAAARAGHARYFLGLAEAAEGAYMGPDLAPWLDRLEAELDNLRAALEWCRDAEADRETGLRLGAALWLFWDVRGYQREGRARLEAALAALPAADAAGRPAARAKALTMSGYLAMMQSDYAAGRPLAEAGAALAREGGDDAVVSRALEALAHGAIQELADEARTTALAQEALALARRRGDVYSAASALFALGLLAWHRGDDARARALYEESVGLLRGIGSAFGLPFPLHNLGVLAWRRGEYVAALALEREALALRRDAGNKRGIALSLEGLAWLATSRRRPERAARLFGAAEALREAMGARLPPFRQDDHDRSLAAARAQLGAPAFAAAWAAGGELPLEAAIAEALAVDDPAAHADAPLSARELEVAALIAQGLTNQEIADRLIIGRRTAETHAAHILGKLGLASRPQIAAWFIERGHAAPAGSVGPDP